MQGNVISFTNPHAPDTTPLYTSGLSPRDYHIVVSDEDDNVLISNEKPSKRGRKSRKRKRKNKNKNVNFAKIIETIGTPDHPVRNPYNNIPVIVTQRSDDEILDENEEDFSIYVRNRTKRLFVGGFNNSINENKIAQYVRRRGPKVTKVNIFPCRRDVDSVVVQLNVEANADSSLLEMRGFWPRGVFCKPWQTRNNSSSVHKSRSFSAPRFDRNSQHSASYREASANYEDENIYQYLHGTD